jgi:endonuclease-3
MAPRNPRRAVDVPAMLAVLKGQHPDAHCELNHENPFQLLVATVLSAQATDVAVNKVTPILFSRWPDPKALASAPTDEVEKVIGSLGFFRQKTKSITTLSRDIVDKHGGQVPSTLAELTELRGVGRKTANVVLGVAFRTPEGVVVDTHVQRLSQRLGWTLHDSPEDIERDLMKALPKSEWDIVSHTLIFHGRRVCTARKPACAACSLSEGCPSAFKAEQVGRKPPRVRTDRPKSKKKLAKKKAKKKAGKKKPVRRKKR